MKFSAGQSVYYYRATDGITVPATVVKCGPKKALIDGDFPEVKASRKAWVSPSNLELQSA